MVLILEKQSVRSLVLMDEGAPSGWRSETRYQEKAQIQPPLRNLLSDVLVLSTECRLSCSFFLPSVHYQNIYIHCYALFRLKEQSVLINPHYRTTVTAERNKNRDPIILAAICMIALTLQLFGVGIWIVLLKSWREFFALCNTFLNWVQK